MTHTGALLEYLNHNDIFFLASEPMSRHTTFRIGGPADLYLDWHGDAPLDEILCVIRASGQPLYILGRGSNVLVHDEGVRGVVLNTLSAGEIACEGETITAGCGMCWAAPPGSREALEKLVMREHLDVDGIYAIIL